MKGSEYLERLEQKYENQLQDNPASNSFVLLAEVLLKQKKSDKALKVLVNGLRHNKNNTTARFLLGRIYFERWLIDSAKKEFEKVLQLAPDNIAVSKILLQIYSSEGNEKRVKEISKNILFLHSDNLELNEFLNDLNLVSQTIELKDIVDEYADFKSSAVNVKDNNNESDIVSTTLAELYYKQGHYKDSLEIYNKLLLINPSDKSIIERIEKLKSLNVS